MCINLCCLQAKVGFQKKLLRLETAPECKNVQLQVSTKAACLSALENTQLRQMSSLEILASMWLKTSFFWYTTPASVYSLYLPFRKSHIHSKHCEPMSQRRGVVFQTKVFPSWPHIYELCARNWLLEEPKFVPTIRKPPMIYGIWNLITVK